MLERKYRLTADKDFTRIFRKGRRFFGAGVNLVMVPNKLAVSRFGFVVGTKVSKRATVRNLIKRRLREIVRLRIGGVRPGFDVALITDRKVLGLDYEGMTAVVVGLLGKARLF